MVNLSKGYKTTALPVELYEKIEKLIKAYPEKGYRSVLEFVIDAVRRRLEEIEKEIKEELA
jgi:metal-responsive CopG/Arc/MetJ family transcriptional regulator